MHSCTQISTTHLVIGRDEGNFWETLMEVELYLRRKLGGDCKDDSGHTVLWQWRQQLKRRRCCYFHCQYVHYSFWWKNPHQKHHPNETPYLGSIFNGERMMIRSWSQGTSSQRVRRSKFAVAEAFVLAVTIEAQWAEDCFLLLWNLLCILKSFFFEVRKVSHTLWPFPDCVWWSSLLMPNLSIHSGFVLCLFLQGQSIQDKLLCWREATWSDHG